MSFIYFLATASKKPEPKEIRQAGIEYAFDHSGTKSREVFSGPGGKRGLLLCRSGFGDVLGYDPTSQQWRQISETAWVGRNDNYTPKPGDLQRPEMVEGVRVELADGNIWLAAHARKFVELEPGALVHYCPLPKTLSLIDGQWRPDKIHRRFRIFAELAEAYQTAAYAALAQSETPSNVVKFEFSQIDDFAVMALTANYYVSHVELDMMEAYDEASRKALISAAMDEKTVFDWQQKKRESALDGFGSSDGLEPSMPEQVS